MTRVDCISNRNIKIIATYLMNRLGHSDNLFQGLPYPAERYKSPEDFFMNEDEWTTYDNFHQIFRRAKDLSEEIYFYFNCGASSASLRSWGRFEYFVRIFASPDDGFRKLPFFNSNFNDTKEIEVICPPAFDKFSGKIRVILKVRYHDDVDVEKDYMCDAYRRGIVSSIPTIWGLRPAFIKQSLNQYDPEILLNQEPEFARHCLDARMDNGFLTIKDPSDNRRKNVGKKILLEPDLVNGKKVFLGRYSELPKDSGKRLGDKKEAVLITDTVREDNRILLKAGEIFKAPYFILDVTYDRFSSIDRLSQVFRIRKNKEDSGKHLFDTINGLKETIRARNRAYRSLKIANDELKEAKKSMEEYNRNLEKKVDERTAELSKAQKELVLLNRGLEEKVKKQVEELKRYNDLGRYLSPKLADKILSSGGTLGTEPQRKMMTVLFTDIRNFSTLTDSLEPEELFHLLDNYLSEMTKLIHHYEGTLNKIIGDGMLIFFGDPIPMEDHAQRSVLMAIDMQKKVSELKDEWLHYGYELGVGIGINTGYMTVGNIGSDMHMDYTVIGNQVNVAARLESLAKPGQILVSQRTYSRVREIVKVEKMGEIAVKGIHDPVVTYNVKVS
ncbi:adenylate/guanylate cyclase domain-containing protein [Thermodesulfobacteriota bacterium]